MARYAERLRLGTTREASEEEIDGMATLIHESLHAQKPAAEEHLVGAADPIDEACTELMTRKLMRERLSARNWKVETPGDGPAHRDRIYDEYITGVRDAVFHAHNEVARASGRPEISLAEAAARVEAAAEHYLKHPTGDLAGKESVVDWFVSGLNLDPALAAVDVRARIIARLER